MARIDIDHVPGGNFQNPHPCGDKQPFLVALAELGIYLAEYLSRGGACLGVVLDQRLCDDHKQGSRHTFARHVRDHHCQMSLVHQKEIVKVSPHLLGRLHGCIDVKFRPVWEGRENARQHAGLDMGGHVQFRPDAFLFRCHS